MKKDLKLFQTCFNKAFGITNKLTDYNMFTYEELMQESYLVFYRARECEDEKTYITYMVGRLIGAIKDYRRKILKTRKTIHGKNMSINDIPNYTNNISLEFLLLRNNDSGEAIELKETIQVIEDHPEKSLETSIIIKDVLSNGLLTKREKVYFSLSFIEDLEDKEIADHIELSQARISQIKKQVYFKLRKRYAETN